MTDLPHTPAVAASFAGELRLLEPRVRSCAELMGALLHPEFTEVGASGRQWTRAEIIAELTASQDPSEPAVTASRMRGTQLADDVVQLTFDTECGPRRAHRSSLWRLTPDGWQLWYHQGTPIP